MNTKTTWIVAVGALPILCASRVEREDDLRHPAQVEGLTAVLGTVTKLESKSFVFEDLGGFPGVVSYNEVAVSEVFVGPLGPLDVARFQVWPQYAYTARVGYVGVWYIKKMERVSRHPDWDPMLLPHDLIPNWGGGVIRVSTDHCGDKAVTMDGWTLTLDEEGRTARDVQVGLPTRAASEPETCTGVDWLRFVKAHRQELSAQAE